MAEDDVLEDCARDAELCRDFFVDVRALGGEGLTFLCAEHQIKKNQSRTMQRQTRGRETKTLRTFFPSSPWSA